LPSPFSEILVAGMSPSHWPVAARYLAKLPISMAEINHVIGLLPRAFQKD
jgi:hypothetical protein